MKKPKQMKTAEETLLENISWRRQDFLESTWHEIINAMEEHDEKYTIEILKRMPEGMYKHDTLFTNPNTQETFTIKELIKKLGDDKK